MGLANTTTNLSYARNELIKVGESFIFDKVADMIWYMMTNDDISTTSTEPITVGSDGDGEDVKLFGDTSGSYWEWDADNDNQNFVNARQNWTTTGLDITNAAGNARQLYGQFTADSIADEEHLTAMQLRASWNGSTTESGEGITGAEIKARAAGTSVTDTLGQARAIVGNVDAKKATFTVGHIFEAQADVGSGGEITTLKGFRASLNNSGTVGTGYAFIVETANTTYNWDYGFYCGTSMADIGLYIGSATTGIQLAGTQTTGITIGSSVTTAINVDSLTDAESTVTGSIHTDGGVGIAKKLYVGDDIVGTVSTGADVNVNGIFETLTVTGNCSGSVCGIRTRAMTDGSSARTIGNFYGANIDARLVHANDALSGIMAGLQVAVSLGECTTGSLWVYGVNIDLSEAGGARATDIKAFINFQDYDYAGTYRCANLFDVGGSASRASTGTSGDLVYNETLKILVNTADRYIPLSTVEGTYTSAYPVSLSYAGAAFVLTGTARATLGTSGAGALVLTAGSPILSVYSTCAGESGSTNAEPVIFDSVMTGAGQVGGRVLVNMTTDVKLGGWANAFKAQVNCSDNGGSSGQMSVACLEMVFPGSKGDGRYSLLELEANCPGSWVGEADNYPTYISCHQGGTTVANWDTVGNLFIISGYTAAQNKFIYQDTIRMKLGLTNMWIPLSSVQGTYTTAYPIVSTYSAATALDINSSMATAHNVVDITVTDATSLDAGRGRALYLKYTVSGTKTDAFAVRTAAIDTYISNNCPEVTGLDMYMGNIDDKTMGNVFGIAMYCEDIGSSVGGSWVGIDMGRVIENTATGRDTFMRFKSHGATTRAKSIFYLEGSNSKLADQLIMFAGAGEGASDWIVTSHDLASGHSQVGAIRIGKEAVAGGGVTTQFYIPIYTAD